MVFDPAERRWHAMRDLKRRNAKMPAYKLMTMLGLEVFTPMVMQFATLGGKKVRQQVPFMQDLLFVKESREVLDPIVEENATLQYRFKIGAQHTPIVVPTEEMERFIVAVQSRENPQYFSPQEITPQMLNRPIRIVGGQLDGFTGTLVTTRGSKTKRLLVELKGLLAAAVEVEPDYIQLL